MAAQLAGKKQGSIAYLCFVFGYDQFSDFSCAEYGGSLFGYPGAFWSWRDSSCFGRSGVLPSQLCVDADGCRFVCGSTRNTAYREGFKESGMQKTDKCHGAAGIIGAAAACDSISGGWFVSAVSLFSVLKNAPL